MKSKRRSFELRFSKDSTHWVTVQLHSSRSAMRGVLTLKGHESSHTDAACWQANQPGKDQCVAEIHFGSDHLTLDAIVHECCHAAYHRARLCGIPLTNQAFEEWVADDTGRLSDALVALFDHQKILVKYKTVNRKIR